MIDYGWSRTLTCMRLAISGRHRDEGPMIRDKRNKRHKPNGRQVILRDDFLWLGYCGETDQLRYWEILIPKIAFSEVFQSLCGEPAKRSGINKTSFSWKKRFLSALGTTYHNVGCIMRANLWMEYRFTMSWRTRLTSHSTKKWHAERFGYGYFSVRWIGQKWYGAGFFFSYAFADSTTSKGWKTGARVKINTKTKLSDLLTTTISDTKYQRLYIGWSKKTQTFSETRWKTPQPNTHKQL